VNLGPASARAVASLEALRDGLQALAKRHIAEADVYHVGSSLAVRCNEVARSIGDGEASAPEPADDLSSRAQQGDPAEGMELVHDLRRLAVDAHGAQIDVLILHQGAMAARDQALVMAAKAATAEIARVDKWLTARIKESAPQAIASML
jgi:hypothetical protein